ncbi:MAG: ABC transporter ATP-binding protein [Anaerolineae bacterium]|jgi:ATP-binding cassette subfamily B protein
MSVFYGLDTEAYDRQYTDSELLKRIVRYFVPHRRNVIIIGVLVAAISLIGAAQPLVVSRGLDLLVASPALSVVIIIFAVVLVIGILNWTGNWWRRRLIGRVIGDTVQTLRQDAFQASMNHDMSFFDEFQSGRIISRITSDTEEFAQVVLLVTDLVGQILLVLVLTVVLVTVSWRLTLALLALTPIVFLLAMGFRRVARMVTRKGFRAIAEVNAAIQEAVTGISVAKNFRQEAAIYNSFSSVNRQSYAVNLRRGFVLANIFPVLNALSGVGTAMLVYWGGLTVADGAISLGAWYLFIMSVDRYWFPMINVSAFWSQFQAGLAAAERIFALIDAEPTVRQIDDVSTSSLTGEIVFDEVDFQYSSQEKVLQGFSLRIAPGESVALVGHTGAGKTSIARLITRFYEYQHGRIAIDGHDLRSLNLNELRQHIGFVTQSPFLFAGTVADNIRYSREDMSDREIEQIARTIGGGEWLEALPEGLETDVGERGSHLSMGQRQLVALMRVLVQSPEIFILDEATASVDPFTEAQIQEATELILARSTSILIAHRLSTVRRVDRIIVLESGRIIEEGNHDELMAQGGHYAELYDTYFRHQSPDYRPPPVQKEPAPETSMGA